MSSSTDTVAAPYAEAAAKQPESDGAQRVAQTKGRRASRLTVLILQIVVFIVVFGGWEMSVRLGYADPFFFSKPSDIVARSWEWMIDGTIWKHLMTTMIEAALGFAIGTLAGVVVGMVFARVDLVARVFDPYIRITNALPRLILAPIFLLWFGLDIGSKVALVATMVFFVVFFNTYQGVREVDVVILNNVRVLQANDRHLLRFVYLPSAMSWIFSSFHTSVGFALISAIVGEYMGASQGMGYLIQNSQGLFDTTGVMAGLVITSVVVLIIDLLISRLEAYLLRWRPRG